MTTTTQHPPCTEQATLVWALPSLSNLPRGVLGTGGSALGPRRRFRLARSPSPPGPSAGSVRLPDARLRPARLFCSAAAGRREVSHRTLISPPTAGPLKPSVAADHNAKQRCPCS
ncbi:Hypothetical predicted protein [Podarcis lilfordi]|uniref:Uncharacterized protein n=1 Tax=Podarcis lilfordi TaxID=74358 RepID=A0AA35PN97_9SAUR|nr:Hypothetical predicted protein [Podarcis lilfordi]